jgi:hypothetical protein
MRRSGTCRENPALQRGTRLSADFGAECIGGSDCTTFIGIERPLTLPESF